MIRSDSFRHLSLRLGTTGDIKPLGLVENVCGLYTFSASGCLFIVFFKETKPSSQDGGDKKDGEYIKLKVIGQVCMHAGVMDGHH